jgi:hypothetical protein
VDKLLAGREVGLQSRSPGHSLLPTTVVGRSNFEFSINLPWSKAFLREDLPKARRDNQV